MLRWVGLETDLATSLSYSKFKWPVWNQQRPFFLGRITDSYRYGRVTRVEHPAVYGADQPFEWRLCRTGDRQFLAVMKSFS
jgi:hypothetical protein